MGKKFPLLLSFWLAAVFAAAQTDPQGNTYRIWLEKNNLKLSRSADQGITFTSPMTIYSFTQEVNSYDLKTASQLNFFLVYEINGEVSFASSSDGGKTFGPTQVVSRDAYSPKIAADNNLAAVAWETKNGDILYRLSQDAGARFEDTKVIYLTGEALSSPSLAIDASRRVHLIFLSKDSSRGAHRLCFASLDNLPHKVLLDSPQQIIEPELRALPYGLAVYFQREALGQKEKYLLTSLDFGKSFSREKIIKEGKIDPPPIPTLVQTEKGTIVFASPSRDPLLYKIELSSIRELPLEKTWALDHLHASGSPEIRYQIPFFLPDGNYFLRLRAFDGINYSAPSPIAEFSIDTTPPEILLSSTIEAEIKDRDELEIEGKAIGNPTQLTFNRQPVSFEARGYFKTIFRLMPGRNLLSFSASDKAGNTSYLSKEVSYLPEDVTIKMVKPKNIDWFKAGSTILIEAEIVDRVHKVADGDQAGVQFGGADVGTFLVFDEEEKKLSGFVTLPKEAPHGTLSGKIKVAGQEKSFAVNIDNEAPRITAGSSFSRFASAVKLPVADFGAGVDASATLIKFSNVSAEGFASYEPEWFIASVEAGGIVLKLKSPLKDGSFEVEVVPRDLVGNVGPASSLNLVMDTQPPRLILFTTVEARKLVVSGEVSDSYPDRIKIYLNQKLAVDHPLAGKKFSHEVTLAAGNNQILVEATDAAGNKTSQNLETYAAVKLAGALIASSASGPSPFNPKAEEIHITYQLSQSSLLKLFVFDLAGTLLWKREIQNATTGKIDWNGVDQFGNLLANGVYPYLLAATSGGNTEIQRGKIIILQ